MSVAVAVAMAGVVSGCGDDPPPEPPNGPDRPPEPTTVSPPADAVVVRDESDQRVTLRVGQRLVVDLPARPGAVWRVGFHPSGLLRLDVRPAGATTTALTAVAAGQGTVVVTSVREARGDLAPLPTSSVLGRPAREVRLTVTVG